MRKKHLFVISTATIAFGAWASDFPISQPVTDVLSIDRSAPTVVDASKVLQPYIAFDNDSLTNREAPPIIPTPNSNNEQRPSGQTEPIESNTNRSDRQNHQATFDTQSPAESGQPVQSAQTTDDLLNPIESQDNNQTVKPDVIAPSPWLTDSNTAAFSNSSPEIALMLNNQINYLNWRGIDNRLRSVEEVTNLYAQLNYQPLWTVDGKATDLAEQVIRFTLDAKYHALRPEVYHSAATSTIRAGEPVAEPYKFDILLTDAFITLSKHLTNGIVNPKRQFKEWNLDPQPINFKSSYLAALSSNDASHLFVMDDQEYLRLQAAYRQMLDDVSNANQLPQIPDNQTLRLGDQGEAVRLLRDRLGLDISSDIYDEALKAEVMFYQEQHGLSADGIAGKRTIASLNGQTPQAQLQKLAINMERYRWGYVPQHSNYIWVNIPGYEMAIKNHNQTLFQSKVIVGRPSRPTPVFSDVMEHVVLSPYWNVPSTIFREDKLPKLRNNPHALGSSMQVINTRTGKVVNPASVNWANGGAGYRIRQKPGRNNALGTMKFLFPNKHAIYLHDTPDRHLFNRSKRAYSSGCVRVEAAQDFALFLLENEGYNREQLNRDSNRSREKWINLDSPKQYPVFLNYYTAWVDADQQIRFSEDIYGHDSKMIQLYESALKNL